MHTFCMYALILIKIISLVTETNISFCFYSTTESLNSTNIYYNKKFYIHTKIDFSQNKKCKIVQMNEITQMLSDKLNILKVTSDDDDYDETSDDDDYDETSDDELDFQIVIKKGLSHAVSELWETLYPHQQECVCRKRSLPKSLINMWCGTGKTRVFTYSILEDGENVNVIVFPTLGLINQFNNDYVNNPRIYKILEEL